MPSSADIVRLARTWVDTPYKHHGRKRGHACDCVGLVVGTGQDAGFEGIYDRFDYSDHPKAEKLLAETAKALEEQEGRNPMQRVAGLHPGEVVAMIVREALVPQHLGIIGSHNSRLTLIHAFNKNEKVVEHGLTDWWRKRIVRVYRYPGVDY